MLCMLHRHVGLSRPFYVNKIYSFIHTNNFMYTFLNLLLSSLSISLGKNITQTPHDSLPVQLNVLLCFNRGNTPETKGTAFVVYEDIFDAKNACDHLSGFNVCNRYLVVLYYQSNKVRQIYLSLWLNYMIIGQAHGDFRTGETEKK